MNPFEQSHLSEDTLTALFLFDLETKKLLSANPVAINLTGYSLNELLAKTLGEIFHADTEANWHRFLMEMRQYESLPLQAGFAMRKKGNTDSLPVYASVTRLPSRTKRKDRALALISARDSEQVQVQSLFRQAINSFSQSLYVKDKALNFVAVNRAFCAEIGRDPDDILGHDVFSVYPQHMAEKQDEDEHRVLREGRALVSDEQTDVGGIPHTLRVMKTPVHAPNGDIEGVLTMRWDVTEQTRQTAADLQKQKSDAIAKLAGGIAHHFNNLLTILLGNFSLIRTTIGKNIVIGDELNEMFHAAETAGQKSAELVRKMLGFARRLPIRPEVVDLNKQITKTLATFRGMSELTIHEKLDAALWKVYGDLEQLRQLLLYLCVNSIEAMTHGGTLTITSANLHLSPEHLLSGQTNNSHGEVVALSPESRPGDFIQISVHDTGHGIAKEIQPRIFEPFFTSKALGKGTGLSLAMAQGLVQQHQGWINFQSRAGEGTIFNVFLPKLDQAALAERGT